MTSKERIKSLITQRTELRPFRFGRNITKGIYSKLLNYLGLNLEVEILNHIQQLAKVNDSVADQLEVDIKCFSLIRLAKILEKGWWKMAY